MSPEKNTASCAENETKMNLNEMEKMMLPDRKLVQLLNLEFIEGFLEIGPEDISAKKKRIDRIESKSITLVLKLLIVTNEI